MKVIGLTGGIGSGKSTVSRLFELMEIPVYIADTESKRITESSTVIMKKLTQQFGKDLYKDGKLNKSLLATLIFENDENRLFVNSVIHPEVRIDFAKWKERNADFPLAVIESAILFETGLNETVDVSLAVAAPEETRIRRVELRDGLSRKSILSRIRSQFSDEEKISRSDYIIHNDDIQPLIPQVEKIAKILSQ